ncbi:MAG: nucleotide sugar dehydrogenase, partial [Lachnospiraceae bacterium]|nr:nucleotide sugar dehydrogenase [Lachnospiraceae bacterium]
MVTVFGLGFVGLTTALGFAHMGYRVYGVDVDERRKDTLRQGKLPFYEPYMEDVLQEHLGKNFLGAEDAAEAVADSEFVFFCVGTPYGKDGSADLTYLFQALDMAIDGIADEKFRVMVVKSTVPPGTTAERVAPYVKEKGEKAAFISVANNPEFLREGHCWEDFIHADRIVLGCDQGKAEEMLKKLYEPMDVPVFCVSHNTGEFIKYLSNTLLATMISYSNEMARIADSIGNIETAEAFRILHMDRRWDGCQMTSYVYPGCGYGGYCLPKDTNALLARARETGCEPAILREVISVNDNIAKYIAEKIKDAAGIEGD